MDETLVEMMNIRMELTLKKEGHSDSEKSEKRNEDSSDNIKDSNSEEANDNETTDRKKSKYDPPIRNHKKLRNLMIVQLISSLL